MALISQIQTLVPAAFISYGFPLPIVVSLWVSFGQWLRNKRRAAAVVYIFSILTGAIAQTTPLSLSQAATVGGILAPTLYSLLFIGFGIARALRTPYGHQWQRSYMKRSTQLKRWVEGMLGACIGGVTGATIGILLGYFLILVAYTATFLIAHSFRFRVDFQVIDLTIYGIGTLGAVLGLLTGLGFINWQRLSEKLVIYLVIYFSFIATVIKRTW
jgi:hypothetical protein